MMTVGKAPFVYLASIKTRRKVYTEEESSYSDPYEKRKYCQYYFQPSWNVLEPFKQKEGNSQMSQTND